MTEQRPCFACAHFHVDPETGSGACCRPGADARVTTYLALWCAREEGAAGGPDGRLFAARLLQHEEQRGKC